MFDYNLIYNTYFPKLKVLVSKQLKDKDSVEDIVQDILLKVYTEQDKYDKDKELSTWIYSIAFNVIKDYFKSFRGKPHLDYVSQIYDNEHTLSTDDPLNILTSAETEHKYETFLNTLSESYLTAYTMKDIEGKTYKDISTQLGVSENTIKSRVKRARDSISAYITAA